MPPNSFTSPAAAVAQRFLANLEALEIDTAMGCFAEDAVQEMPFAPSGFPGRLDGADALRRQYSGLPAAYRSMRFEVTDVYTAPGADWAVLEYRGEIELAAGGRYDNRYIGFFHTRDGRIRSFREFFNPIVLSQSFDPDQIGAAFSTGGGA